MATAREIVIGTRGSQLATSQTLAVLRALQRAHPGQRFRVETIQTHGDRDRVHSLTSMGSGIFTRELELALIEGRIDLAVHSLKDLPTELPRGLGLAPAVPPREDPRDVLVTRDGRAMALLPPGARVGTDSPRRRAQLAAWRDDLKFEAIRGNVETRLRKLRDGPYDAIVLARAGLARLELLTAAMEVLAPELMLPAPGQGALGLEIRQSDAPLTDLCRALDHEPSRQAALAERAFLGTTGAGCHTPVAALGEMVRPGELRLRGLIAAADGRRMVRDELCGAAAEAERLGRELAERILAAGGRELLGENPGAAG